MVSQIAISLFHALFEEKPTLISHHLPNLGVPSSTTQPGRQGPFPSHSGSESHHQCYFQLGPFDPIEFATTGRWEAKYPTTALENQAHPAAEAQHWLVHHVSVFAPKY